MQRNRGMLAFAAGLLAMLAVPGAVRAQDSAPAPARLPFVTHAEFFSSATHRPSPIDPQIFIKQATVPEATGPQGIDHVAGERPARPDDVPDLPAYNARGTGLGFTVGRWFAAMGTVALEPLSGGGERVSTTFSKLLPFGVYSLFRIAFTPAGAVFTPLDGTGAANSFTAGGEGNANLAVTVAQPLVSGDAIVLVYHSDAKTHADSRGELGVTAHQQLIVRLP